jgi:uncharacterized protein (DUF2141 family)
MELFGGTLFPDYQVFRCAYFSRWLGITILSVTTAYAVATLSWYFIEKPVLDRVHGLTKGSPDKKVVMPILRKVIVVLLFGAFLTNPMFQGNNAEEAVSIGEGSGKIRIEIKNIRNTNGQIIVSLYNSAKGFPEAQFKNLTIPITGNSVEAVVEDLPYGAYAVLVCHDENNNGKQDMNGNMPAEGYGISNNPRDFPTFSNSKFILKEQETTSLIHMNYL